ncbi:MAG: SH3 domain-containing protein [Caldilineaceae bacterium]|nr:SH3 domain-containing protein [Caldilineaceae bacterium]
MKLHDSQLRIALLLGSLLLLWGIALTGAPPALAQTPTRGVVLYPANLRAGPGTTYAIVGALRQGDAVVIRGMDAAGAWYQLDNDQWIAAFLVNTTGTIPAATAAPTKATPVAAAANLFAESLQVTANRAANLRAGPGTTYAIVGTVGSGQALTVVGATTDQSWYQLDSDQWIAAFLVANIAPNTTATPLPAPAPAAVPTTSPASDTQYVVVEKRLWDPYENGGSLDGPSVHCGYGRQLVVTVLDTNGNRVNGVAVQVQYGAREIEVTGAQGRGDGVAEFVLGSGQDVKLIRDSRGSAVTSAVATGLSTNPAAIPFEFLLSSQYCQDEATCRHFAETNSCNGHFSWSVTFQQVAP